jgi:hypothetical protein
MMCRDFCLLAHSLFSPSLPLHLEEFAISNFQVSYVFGVTLPSIIILISDKATLNYKEPAKQALLRQPHDGLCS